MSNNNIVLKICWKDDMRRLPVPSNISFQSLRQTVSQMFNLSEFRVKYIDEDQELITVCSDRELQEAISYLREQDPRRIVRFHIRTPEDASTDITQSIAFQNSVYQPYDPSRSFSTIPGPYPPVNMGHPSIPNFNPSYPPQDPRVQMVNPSYPPQDPSKYQHNQGVLPQVNIPLQPNSSIVQPDSNELPNQYSHNNNQSNPKQEPNKNVNVVVNKPHVPMVKGSEGKYDSRFVRDKELPDGTKVQAGSRFTKVWVIKNSGDLPWPTGTQLDWQSGDQLETPERVVVPEAKPGEDVDISIDIIAPLRPGTYAGHFRMVLPNGKPFGNRIWADFVVQ